MTYPRILIDVNKIRANTAHAVEVCGSHGIEVIGVTKACLGDPIVAGAMIHGGVKALGDSRLSNLVRLRGADVKVPLMMLRLPMLSEIPKIAVTVEISLNSDLSVMEALGQAAVLTGKKHQVIVMVDVGDGREGVSPEDVAETVASAARLPGITVAGLGANVACLTGRKPTPGQMKELANLAELPVISGGNSSAWELIESGDMPARVNQVRLGEAILLGRETARGRSIKDMHGDAFVIEAEVIESIPGRGGHHIVAIGRQDIDETRLNPLDKTWRIVKASSDHLVLAKSGPPVRTGGIVSFIPGYESLLRAMTSPFVAKQYVSEYNY